MGRKKLEIGRLASVKARQTKYSKRKVGLLKKAKELSVLCDIDLALLMFSPTEKPSLYVGQNKELITVMEKLAKVSIEHREDRRNYSLKLLKKMYANTKVDPRNFSLDSIDSLELQGDRLRELKENLNQKIKTLRGLRNPCDIKDLAQVNNIEGLLVDCLSKIRDRKSQLMEEGQRKYEANQEQADKRY